jgi:hypothetical protein
MTFKSTIPEGISNDWRVESFIISPEEASFHNLRCAINPHHSYGREILSGTYKKLLYKGNIVMSDTPAEIRDHLPFTQTAKGHVLIAGLGLGVVTQMLMLRKCIKSITVIELSQDVINLVGLHILKDSKDSKKDTTIICSDIFKYQPKKRLEELGIEKFSFCWLDIWYSYGADLLKDARVLRKRFSRFVIDRIDIWAEYDSLRAVRF